MEEYYNVGDIIQINSRTIGIDVETMQTFHTIGFSSEGEITYLPPNAPDVLVAEFNVRWQNGKYLVAEALICKSECEVHRRSKRHADDTRIYELDCVRVLKDVLASDIGGERVFPIQAGEIGTVIIRYTPNAFEVEFGIPDENNVWDWASTAILREDLELFLSEDETPSDNNASDITK